MGGQLPLKRVTMETIIWLWVQNGYPKWSPGEWNHRLKPRNPSSLSLSHTHVSRGKQQVSCSISVCPVLSDLDGWFGHLTWLYAFEWGKWEGFTSLFHHQRTGLRVPSRSEPFRVPRAREEAKAREAVEAQEERCHLETQATGERRSASDGARALWESNFGRSFFSSGGLR